MFAAELHFGCQEFEDGELVRLMTTAILQY
jgi:hypothetical protein